MLRIMKNPRSNYAGNIVTITPLAGYPVPRSRVRSSLVPGIVAYFRRSYAAGQE